MKKHGFKSEQGEHRQQTFAGDNANGMGL